MQTLNTLGPSIRRRQGLRLLYFHLLVAALESAFAGFRTKQLGPADLAFVSLSKFTHSLSPPSKLADRDGVPSSLGSFFCLSPSRQPKLADRDGVPSSLGSFCRILA